MIPPPDDTSPLEPESPSIMGRIGEQLANTPANLFNDLMRLQYNLGLHDDDQHEAPQGPVPFQIPEAKTTGEGIVDIGANIVQSLPLFLTGEGAGAGVARLASAGPIAARMLRMGAGFGVGGLTQSPEHAAVETALGAGFGAAESLPGPLKYLAALGVGLGTFANLKHEGATDTRASIMGVTQAALPLLLHARGRTPKVAAEPPIAPLQLGYRPEANRYLEDVQTTTRVPGSGGVIPYGGELEESTTRGMPVAGTERLDRVNGRLPADSPFRMQPSEIIEGDFTDIPKLLPAPPERLMTDVELRRGLGVRPPPGSLIREPAITMDEVRSVVAARTPTNGRVIPFTEREKPIAAAIKMPDGKIFTGPSHPHAADIAFKDSTYTRPSNPYELLPEGAESGFATNKRSFVSTDEAWILAQPEDFVGGFPSDTDSRAFNFSLKGNLSDTIYSKNLEKATQPPTKVAPKRVLLSSVLHESDEELVKKAAKKLNLEYKGVQDNAGRYPNQLYFNLTTPGRETTIAMESGLTYKDLKNKVIAKNAQYDAAEAAAAKRPKKVATLQPAGPQPGSANAEITASPSSSLEPVQLPQGLKIGDQASIKFEGETHVATILGPGELPDTIKVRTKTYGDLDRPLSDISQLGVRAETNAPIKSVGGMQELEKLGTEPQQGFKKSSGGKMKLSNFGEHGFITPEARKLLLRYGVAPAIGGAIGYEEDEQHRIGSAISGAVIGGLAGHFGGRVLDALLERSKGKVTKTSTGKTTFSKSTPSETVRNVARAIIGDKAVAEKTASRWNDSTALEKFGRWMNQNFRTNVAFTRMRDKAYGAIDDLSRIVDRNMMNLVRSVSNADYVPITQFLEGKINFATLQSRVPTQVADMVSSVSVAFSRMEGIISDSLGGGKLATTIKQNMGKYLTTTYKIFHDPKYRPTDDQILKAAQSLNRDFGENLETRIDLIHQYLQEIAVNRKLFQGGLGGLKGESVGRILSRAQSLTPEFKEMLGIYDNPIDRMAHTAMKLVNSGRSAELFNEVARGTKANGLKFAYSIEERQAAIATLQHEAQYNFTPEARAAAQTKLDELRSYVYNPVGESSGRLSNKFMDLNARDQLANFDGANRTFKSPIVRQIANATNLIKYGKVVSPLAPLQFIRQVIQLPILGMVARTFPQDWAKAFNVLWLDKSAAGVAERSRLRNLGILTGDTIGGMFHRDMQAMMDGGLEAKLNSRFKKGLHNWEEIWRTPDLVIRISAFLKKEAEYLKDFDPETAANKAIDYTNRYTMNYGAVPPIVMKGRQLPFINQYLSWTYETLRITKNLVEDARKGDVYAIGVLTTMATVPLAIQQMSESQLSDSDRAEWNKVKNLGPSYNRYNFRFVQGKLPNGDFRYIDYTPLVIHDQLMRMIRSMGAGDSEAFMAANPIAGWENTPLLNVATILKTGRDQWSGDNFQSVGDYAHALRREVLPPLLGTELDRVAKALTPNSEGGLGVHNLRTGQGNSMSDILQTYLTAMRPYTVRPRAVEAQVMSQAKEQIRMQIGIFRKIQMSNYSDARKQQAKQDFENAVKEILKGYHSKVGDNLTFESAAP